MNYGKLIAILLAAMFCASFMFSCNSDMGVSGDKAGDSTASDGDTGDDTSSENTPEMFDYSAGLTEEGHFEGVTAKDIITLPQYKGIELPEEILTPDSDSVSLQIERILEDYTDEPRPVVDGDTVNIDYVGTIDGVEFENGSTQGRGTDVTIGVTNYIDDFLEQLIGHTPGETFDVNVTFPEDYGNEAVDGKDAVFTVTINSITATELTDEMAADYGFETADELIADITEWVMSNQILGFVDELISEAVCEDLPQSVLDYIINADIAYYESYASAYGMDIDSYIANVLGSESKEAYIEENLDSYKDYAVSCLAYQAIAEAEGITVTDEDITEAGFDDYITTYGKPYIKQYLLTEAVADFIYENASNTTAE